MAPVDCDVDRILAGPVEFQLLDIDDEVARHKTGVRGQGNIERHLDAGHDEFAVVIHEIHFHLVRSFFDFIEDHAQRHRTLGVHRRHLLGQDGVKRAQQIQLAAVVRGGIAQDRDRDVHDVLLIAPRHSAKLAATRIVKSDGSVEWSNGCHSSDGHCSTIHSLAADIWVPIRGKHYSCVPEDAFVSSAPFMATIKPFAALRPRAALAPQICELPYDVMSSEEARVTAAGNVLSFLHVSKPEIDLPPGTDLYSPAVYAKGKENFEKLIRDGALAQDQQPCFYLYRQILGSHHQTGLAAAASCQEYLDGVIRKHELTRPDKEDDRVRHIEALNSQTGPVFLTYRVAAAIDDLVKRKTSETPAIDFTAKDGVRHTAWTIKDAATIALIESEFAKIPFLYIADGHHRSAAAARVYRSREGAGNSARFLAVIFPHNQMQILPYNRVLKALTGLKPGALLQKLDAVFVINPAGAAKPTRKHELGFYLQGQWHTLNFRPQFAATSDPIEKLDVTLLQKYVLDPIFSIDDPRTSKRVNFVGGIRGTAELEKRVNNGEYTCAFSMFPTGIEDLMTIADAGGIMPPKSTWFEPKLRDAMFCHMLA